MAVPLILQPELNFCTTRVAAAQKLLALTNGEIGRIADDQALPGIKAGQRFFRPHIGRILRARDSRRRLNPASAVVLFVFARSFEKVYAARMVPPLGIRFSTFICSE